MTKIDLSAQFNEALDPFLMGSFGVEENGMTLSVLSVLARSGLDPWAEAGRLASLPKPAAAEVIGRYLAPNGSPTIAARLAALLPEPLVEARPGRNLGNAIRRNVWLLLALWLGACVFYLTITNAHTAPQHTEPGVSSDEPGISDTR